MMERLLVCFVAAKADRHASRPNRRIVSCSAASNQSTYNGIWLLVCLASAKADRHASFQPKHRIWLLVCLASAKPDRHASRPNRRIVAYSAASNQNTCYYGMAPCLFGFRRRRSPRQPPESPNGSLFCCFVNKHIYICVCVIMSCYHETACFRKPAP